MMTADDVIRALDLRPHPEGGYYRETFRDPDGPRPRGWSTAIYYVLGQGERSHWHKVDAAELWFFHAGDPLALSLSPDGRRVDRRVLGVDFASGALPQVVVPPHCWQSAEPLGRWTLVSCAVSPGFEFQGFEMAPPGWRPTEF